MAGTGAPTETSTDDLAPLDEDVRVICLVRGSLEGGGLFWCYVALKPSMGAAYVRAMADGTLDLWAFDAYGEIIVSCAGGHQPPAHISRTVAFMYGCDPADFLKPLPPLTVKSFRALIVTHLRRLVAAVAAGTRGAAPVRAARPRRRPAARQVLH